MNNIEIQKSPPKNFKQTTSQHTSHNINSCCPICERRITTRSNTKTITCKSCSQEIHFNCINENKPTNEIEIKLWNCTICSTHSPSTQLNTTQFSPSPIDQLNTMPNSRSSLTPRSPPPHRATTTQHTKHPPQHSQQIITPPISSDKINNICQQADQHFDKENPSNKDLMNVMQGILQSQQFISNQFDDFHRNLHTLKEENTQLKSTVNSLETKIHFLEKELGPIQSEINQLQQAALSKHLVITGIPTNQPPPTIITTIGNILKVNIAADDIKNTRFLHPKNKPQKYAPLLIELNTKTLCEQIMNTFKQNGPILPEQINISSSHKNIFINEYLTETNRNLLTQARKLKNTHGTKFIWYKHGFVWAKQNEETQSFRISSITDLNAFITNLHQP